MLNILKIKIFSNNGLKVLSGGCSDEHFFDFISTSTISVGINRLRATCTPILETFGGTPIRN